MAFGQKVHGKVTFNGQPLPYGFVLFYSHDKSAVPKTGIVPVAHAKIANGSYAIQNAPAGPMKVCVFTDPDADPSTVLTPIGSGGRSPKAGPPGKGGETNKGRENPFTKRLNDEQIVMLRTVHGRFGEFANSPLMYVVQQGDQTWDIDLK
jgi:hypothetical protein